MIKSQCESITQEDFDGNIKSLYEDLLTQIEDRRVVDLLIKYVYKAGYTDGLKLMNWLQK